MQASAAIINAGLGDLSLGLQMSGFQIVADYEADEKAIVSHQANIDVPVYPLPSEGVDLKHFPQVDLLVVRSYSALLPSTAYAATRMENPAIHSFREILRGCRPRAFLLLVSVTSEKNVQFQELLRETVEDGYQCVWKRIDIAQMTGFPVVEHKVFVIGSLRDTGDQFQFPENTSRAQLPLEKFLQLNQSVDPWYFRVKAESIPRYETGKQLYCWNNHAYVGTGSTRWNCYKIPLIWTGDAFRKMTHREIANLKGFPIEYILSREMDKQWLYQKLIYSCNVFAVKQIADMLLYNLVGNPWRNQQVDGWMRFEDIFQHYLMRWADQGTVQRGSPSVKPDFDFAACSGGQKLYFELKYYKNGPIRKSTLGQFYQMCSSLNADGLPVLVVTNEVSDSLKIQCWEEFHGSIWDVGNLLWLFDEFPDIKNNFIALLDYAVKTIEPKPPLPNLFQQAQENKQEPPSWKSRLKKIDPGRKQFSAYESACVDILKYVLGDSLTLWDRQRQANAGMYRFDLCCKIKNGANHDFFDTIKRHFNTKYIVFEFKNYEEKISQKEIYTTEKYLYEKALRKVAIIISRQGADDHAIQAAKGSLRESGKLILCLSDRDLLQMIDIKERGEEEPAEFLSAMLDDFLIHLEK